MPYCPLEWGDIAVVSRIIRSLTPAHKRIFAGSHRHATGARRGAGPAHATPKKVATELGAAPRVHLNRAACRRADHPSGGLPIVKDEPVHFLDIARGIKGPICGSNLPWPRYDLLTIRTELVTCVACLNQITKYLARARNAETLADGERADDKASEVDDAKNRDRKRGNPLDSDD
jgi:hypothetical protein